MLRGVILLITAVFGLIPLAVSVQLGLLLGWLLRRVIRFRAHVVHSQINFAYRDRKTPAEIDRIIRDHYSHLGLLVMELLRLPRIGRTQSFLDQVTLKGEENLKNALAKGKGVFILGGHLGNWEISTVSTAGRGYNVMAVTKEMKSGAGRELVRMIRDENGVTSIPRRGSVRQILRSLRDGAVIAFVLDQNMTSDEGIFVDFYGLQACTMAGLAVLAERSGAAVVPAAVYREPGNRRHCVELMPEISLETPFGSRDENVRHNTQRFMKVMERLIDDHPAQWLWIHKRWKTRPQGEKQMPFSY